MFVTEEVGFFPQLFERSQSGKSRIWLWSQGFLIQGLFEKDELSIHDGLQPLTIAGDASPDLALLYVIYYSNVSLVLVV